MLAWSAQCICAGADMRMTNRQPLAILFALVLAGCGGGTPAPDAPAAGGGADDPAGGGTPSPSSSPDLGSPAPPSMPPPPPGGPSLTPAQKLRAMQLISVFENGTIVLAYDYVEA